MISRRTLALAAIAAILVASAAVRLVRLDQPPDYIFDEVYYAKDAKALLDGRIGPKEGVTWLPGDEVSWPHPYYGKIAIAAGIALFGDDAFGWRFVPALAGIALLALVYPTARRLGLRREWSLLALILAAADLLGLAQSRIATLDIFVGLWTVLAVYLTLRAVQERRRVLWLALAGVSAGLAVGTKWSGLLAVVAALALVLVLSRPSTSTRSRSNDERRRSRHRTTASAGRWPPSRRAVLRAVTAVGLLVVLPLGLYFASYGVYFAAGHDLADWWHLQREMWTFNMTLDATHTYASLAPTWILDIRPVWYHFEEYAAQYYGVVAMGHPILWWTSVVALVTLPVVALLDRDRDIALPVLLVALLYFPWFIATRTSFIYYMTPVAPFLAILVAAALARLSGRPPRLGSDGRLEGAVSAAPPLRVPGGDTAAAGPDTDGRPSAGMGADGRRHDRDEAAVPAEALGEPRRRRHAVRREQLSPSLLWAAAAFLGATVITALFWWPIGRAVALVLYDWPATLAPAAGIAVATVVGAAALVAFAFVLSRPSSRGARRYLAWGLAGVVVGFTIVFAPIVLDIPLAPDDFYRLIWLPTWL